MTQSFLAALLVRGSFMVTWFCGGSDQCSARRDFNSW